MSEVLYRKYRPKNFSELVGQDQVKEILSKSFEKSSVSHAYIFSGSRGTGKTTSARIFAKMLNCLSESSEKPCGICQSCRAIDTSSHLDVVELDAASYRGIDEIRKIRDSAAYRPVMGHYKIYIIDEFHMLTREAFNALLKTLEEPPEKVIFVLATTNIEKVPETILSRCQIFTFKTLSEEEIVLYLERIATSESFSFSKDGLARIARAARGGMRDAVNLMERVVAFTGSLDDQSVRLTLGILPDEFITSFLGAFSEADPNRLLKVSKDLLDEGLSYESLLEQSIDFLKEVYIKKKRREDLQMISSLWEILKEMKYAEDNKAVFEVMAILKSSELAGLNETTGEVPEKGSFTDTAIAKKDLQDKVEVLPRPTGGEDVSHGPVETLLDYLYEKDFTLLWVLLGLSRTTLSEDGESLSVDSDDSFVVKLIEEKLDMINGISTEVVGKPVSLSRSKSPKALENLNKDQRAYVKNFMDVLGLNGNGTLGEFKIEIEED
jgi:DNA polymerase-3 subunit gamma/tau